MGRKSPEHLCLDNKDAKVTAIQNWQLSNHRRLHPPPGKFENSNLRRPPASLCMNSLLACEGAMMSTPTIAGFMNVGRVISNFLSRICTRQRPGYIYRTVDRQNVFIPSTSHFKLDRSPGPANSATTFLHPRRLSPAHFPSPNSRSLE